MLFGVIATLQSVSSAFHNQTNKENETVVTSQLSRIQERREEETSEMFILDLDLRLGTHQYIILPVSSSVYTFK